jgi:outer membrane protein assembly factor BamB
MFEALTLGVFEVGLSWSIVFGKRDAFRKAFEGFDVAKVAAMTAHDVDRVVQDASIIRNRAKIQATVDNARAMMSASPGRPTQVDPPVGGVREGTRVSRAADASVSYEMTVRRSVLVLACLSLAVTACGGGNKSGVPDGAPKELSTFADEWPAPNQDLGNTRVASGSKIDSGNVNELGVAWTVPIKGSGTFGNYASTPIIADGVAYTQDLTSNVKAIDLQTGQVKWSRNFNAPDVGPNGVALGYGKIYGATSDFAFALNQNTGEEVWRSQKLTRNANEGIDMAPGVFDGTVYVSTVPGNAKSFYKGNGQGVLWALDADAGKPKWKFATVPENLWSPEHKDINSGGGLWHPPAFDDNGDVYIDIANPAPWPGTNELPWGSSRPGPNPHTNSLVKLDRTNGKMIWARQVLAHDVYDWDLQLPPILAKDGDRNLALSAGKLGYVIAIDADDGTIVWKKPVGTHNGHDHDNEAALRGELDALPKLPQSILPGILGGVETQMAVADGVVYAPIVNLPTTFKTQEDPVLQIAKGTGEMAALNVADGSVKWKHDFAQPAYGAATISNDLVFTTTFDGKVVALNRDTGAVAWEKQLPAGTNATIAIVGDTLVTAASFPQSAGQQPVIIAFRLGAKGSVTTTGTTAAGTTTAGSAANGEAIFTASCGSCHTLNAAGTSGTVGPNLDDLKPNEATVDRQVRNGGGGMPAFEGRLSDAQITAVSRYVAQNAGQAGGGGGGGGGP